jgi:hypothetical protein
MTLSIMDLGDAATGTGAQTIPENQTQSAVVGVSDGAQTARALVVVAASGGCIWYVLWKITVYFLVGH